MALYRCLVALICAAAQAQSSYSTAPAVCSAPWAALDSYVASVDSSPTLVLRVPLATASGVGEHVIGTASAFALAVATRRRFRVDWPAAREAFTSRLGVEEDVFLTDGERADLTERLRGGEPSTELVDWLPRSVPDDVDDQVLRNDDLNATFASPTLVVQWRRGLLVRALVDEPRSAFGRVLASLGLTPHTAFACIYRYIFTEPRLGAELAASHERATRDRTRYSPPVVAVHVRTGDIGGLGTVDGLSSATVEASGEQSGGSAAPGLDAPPFEGADFVASDADAGPFGVTNRAYFACAAAFERWEVEAEEGGLPRGFGAEAGRAVWLVASDSLKLTAELAAALQCDRSGRCVAGREVHTLHRSSSAHTSAWPHWKRRPGAAADDDEAPSSLAEVAALELEHAALLQTAAVEALHEQWLLGEAQHHVVSPFSSFGRVAHAISLSQGEPTAAARLAVVLPGDGRCVERSLLRLAATPPFL